jgi:hypothetical protein
VQSEGDKSVTLDRQTVSAPGLVVRRLIHSTFGKSALNAERAPARKLEGKTPTFLIIGAGKCGTTSLWSQLRQHPEIFMHASKHINFFDESDEDGEFRGPPPVYQSQHIRRSWEDYRAEFAPAVARLAIGEACNSYLYSPVAAQRIKQHLPQVKLLALLRHPAERAFSRYLQLRQSGRETLEFGEALRREQLRVEENWWPDFHYMNGSLYYRQLSRFLAHFPRQQIKICLQEDMAADPYGFLNEIFAFINVHEGYTPDTDVRYSPTGLPKSRGVDWALRHLRTARPFAERLLSDRQMALILRVAGKAHARNIVKPKMKAEDRAWVIERCREDTLKLQDHIDRDLSKWLV